MATLGEILRKKRKERGLALRKVAQELDISFSNLSVIERDQRPNPSTKILAKLASFYEIPLELLLAGNGLNLEEKHETIHSNTDKANNTNPAIMEHLQETAIGEQLVNNIDQFSNSINTKINEPRENVKCSIINGSLSDTSFCVILKESMVSLKSDKPIDDIEVLISNYFGKPTAYIEQVDGCIHT